MEVASVGKAMLDAAKAAAGNTWATIQHDFASDLGSVLRNAARIEADLASGKLSEDEASDLLQDQSRTLFILSQEVEVDAELAAQNAINAAIDALWAAVKLAARVP
jgi:hypothetical protein